MQDIFTRVKHKIIRLKIGLYEKLYRKNDKEIKYIWVPEENSDIVVVVFSAFPAKGKKAGYNMLDTFSNIKCNKLYIMDNYGDSGQGCYYLGKSKDFFVVSMVKELIEEKTKNYKRKIFVGSSKGGTAALYYGILCNVDYIIAGAPQYYIGSYLNSEESNKCILRYIMGGTDKKDIRELDDYVFNIIKNNNNVEHIKILLHYSTIEHTYNEHIKFLLDDLRKYGYEVEEDVGSYKEHWEVAKYFPNLCVSQIKKISKENNILSKEN